MNYELRRHVPDAGAEALGLLDPDRGPIEWPIRSEIFGVARFEQHGRSLAQVHEAEADASSTEFFPRLQDNIAVLREAHRYIGLQARTLDIDPAGEWLLDNFHVVVAQIKEIHDGLPRRYFRDLPVLLDAHLAGLPRVYGVAWAFVAHTDSAFDETLLAHFLTAYQHIRPLNFGELWALPTTLRVVLIENLRRLSEGVATAMAARELADLWCARLEKNNAPDIDGLFELLRARGVERAFALQVAARLRSDLDQNLTDNEVVRQAIQAALTQALPDPAAAQLQLQAEQAEANLSLSNTITSLRLLGDIAWRALIARVSLLMHEMCRSEAFRADSDDTQDATLRSIERLARRSGQSELVIAKTLLASMQSSPQVGGMPRAAESPAFWLSGPGRKQLCQTLGVRTSLLPDWTRWRRRALPLYVTTMVLGTAALTFAFVARHAVAETQLWFALAVLLTSLPASEAVIAIVNRLISESVPPQRLPRLAFTNGIPAEHRVLVVIPSMLSCSAEIRSLARKLEHHYLANAERHAQFALLTDYLDADAEMDAQDATLLCEAVAAVDALERTYPPPFGMPRRFLLLHRSRRWSETEQRWIGWERKRGKLMQLVAWLAEGGALPFVDLDARSRAVEGTPYVVTLDSDTELPPGALHALVAIAAHPANRPRIDAIRKRVVSGFGILQPRILTPLPSGAVTIFHWLFAGHSGIDPYSATTSEVYQDLFDEGTFTGKGLLDVHALHAVLTNRLPEGQVLSHDLLEGSIARCGGVSDITLIEDAPMHADVASARVHRWTRGDWQLMPLLLRGKRFGLRTIDRWKLIDNLRRSLVAPFTVVLLATSLFGGPVPTLAALILAIAAFGGGPMLGAIAALAPSRDDLALRHFYGRALADIGRALGGALWNIAQLLDQANLLVDAIVRATYRSAFSRRHLLEWTTASASQAAARTDLSDITLRHLPATALALLLMIAALLAGSPNPILTVLLCSTWAAAPLWIWWTSRIQPDRHYDALADDDRTYLLGVARDSWQFFERHVGADTHNLPPDNVQITPHVMVANRTSPTNIGLYLLALACARRFGWIDTAQLLDRCERTFATLALLPRHRGHFLNWYDTSTLATLPPAYVSTVDSGNLCGHLLALAGACTDFLDESADGVQRERLLGIAATAHRLAMEPDFAFLFDSRRRLFHIGLRVDEHQLDKSFYDLFASESRLASFWAIAKGDVPFSHWAALGRPFYAVGRDAGVRSWSGSMFEYLMPSLVLDEPRGSALGSAACAAIHEQIEYGRARDVPWGISESAYAAGDHTLAYQYAPQGVPRLALRRTPLDELVVAPYATALAAMFNPHAATANLRRLESLGARGEMGFIEAVDFTPERQTGDSTRAMVNTFMAHHKGMTIVALTNALLDGVVRRWGMSNPRISAVASLLQERIPREVSRLLEPPPGHTHADRRHRMPSPVEIVPGGPLQPTHLLSNGRYSVSLRGNGSGWSRFGNADVSRWRDDALRDAHGTFFYLRRNGGVPVSITEHPAPDDDADYRATFHVDRVNFDADWPDLRAHCTVWVSPEDDVELRRIELWSKSSQAIRVELISMFEVSLTDARADEMHPVFTNLFVAADWDSEGRALFFVRNPRLDEQPLHAVHFVAQSDDVFAVRAQTDRAAWLGRNREPSQPLANFSTVDVNGARPTGLDPIASLSMQLVIPPYGSVHVTVGTAAAATRDSLEALVDRYRQTLVIERAALMSTTLSSIRMREMRISSDEMRAIQAITTMLVLLVSRPHAETRVLAFDRRALWRFGISGDRPMIVVEAAAVRGIGLVRSLARALRLWSWGDVACDLVVLDSEPSSYEMPLQRELAAIRELYVRDVPAGPSQLYLVAATTLTPEERAALAVLPRMRLFADGRSLADHVQDHLQWHGDALERRTAQAVVRPVEPDGTTSAVAASRGQFDSAGGFRFSASAASRPARPWINVLANPNFGTQISEAGAGYTWADNSRLHQLTPWSNDPVADPSGESFWLQDVKTRETWNVAATATDTTYTVEHGQGYTTIRHRRGDLDVSATWCVDLAQSIKHVRIAIRNTGPRTRRLRIIGAVDWAMGAQRTDRQSVCTSAERVGTGTTASTVLFATQCDANAGFGGSTAFFAVVREPGDTTPDDWTCDRRELFDSAGRRVIPHEFGRRTGTRIDPCAVLAPVLSIEPAQSRECTFALGHGRSHDAARALVPTALLSAEPREHGVRAHWDALLQTVTVTTPDPLFDVLVNRWLLYQALACRLWARAGFYQAGGAFGFRDQLQDSMALAIGAPQLLRRQLLLSASRQFVEGDVQHWWHPPSGAGVRTRFSDDLLWLPFATVHYVDVTGDATVLDETATFLEGDAIPDGAEDAYFIPRTSELSASLYEHCARTLDRSLGVGAHGLPLMGSGDWNDGLNRVGYPGRGESVWLGWFLCTLVGTFAPIARQRSDTDRADRWERAAHGWRDALRSRAWDGEWFARAFFDDGTPLGSSANDECRIDVVAQAWAVLSDIATPAQQQSCMAAVKRLLVDETNGLVRILDPPLTRAEPDPGYIGAYPPGVRENGGQYSHAGIWALMAQAALGDVDTAYRTFTRLSPAHRSAHPQYGARYQLEPYVMAGDVYSQAPYAGRGGWSWYTGSAAWMYRAAIESICGLQIRGSRISVVPRLPSHWPRVQLTLRRDGGVHELIICAASAKADIEQASADGAVALAESDWLDLTEIGDTSRHLVVIGATAHAMDALSHVE